MIGFRLRRRVDCLSNWDVRDLGGHLDTTFRGWSAMLAAGVRFGHLQAVAGGSWTFIGGFKLWGKWGSTATQMVERFKDIGHLVFKSISALRRGVLQKNNRDTIDFNADASNTELLFRIIHSANQLSIYGAVSNWCERFGLTEEEVGQEKPPGKKESVTKSVSSCVKSQEVDLMVSSPRPASGSSLRENIQDFESLSETIRFTRVCEDAIFVHRVFSWYELQNQT